MSNKTEFPIYDTIPECAKHLAELIRCPTVSLSKEFDTKDAISEPFERLHKTLERLYPAVFDTVEKTLIGSYSLLLRWAGKDSSRSIILTAHQDVVPAGTSTKTVLDVDFIPTGWDYPPFAGQIADGQIRGRGALDDKGSLCGIFEAVEGLIVENFTPEVDIYLCFSHNEETMAWGAPLIVEELEKRGVRPLFVLDEGGAIVGNPFPTMQGKAAMIGITEKGVANLLFTARSMGGHASTPPKGTPLGRLGAFAASIERKSPFTARVTPALQKMLSALAPQMGFPFKMFFCFPRFFAPLISYAFTLMGGDAKSLIQTTCAFTMASGSTAMNVLPDTATFTANLRILGTDSLAGIIESLRTRAKPYNIDVELIVGHEASPVSAQDEMWNHLIATLAKNFPKVLAVPYIMLAASDSRHYCKISPCVYRFSPFEMSKIQRKSIHGFNEYIEIDNFQKGINFYRELITTV